MREVYVLIGEDIIEKVPKSFYEFDDFWEEHENDNGYVMMYLDDNNRVVQ